MNNKKILLIFIIFYLNSNQCQIVNISFNKNFAIYKSNQCDVFNSKYGCYLERYITADGVRIGIKKEENNPYSNSTKTWKESIIHFLEESGYEILESKTVDKYEFIKSIVRYKDENFIYGVAFRMNPENNKEIYIIEFAGLENNFKKYEKEIYQFIDDYLKKK